MLENITTALREWNKKHDSLVKMQHTYGVVAISALVIAGIVGLVNYNLGQSILFISVVFALLFLANAVWWALVQAFVLNKIPRTNRRRK